MRDRYWYLPAQVALPVLAGQFLFDWANDGFSDAIGHLPLRAGLTLAIALGWSLMRKRREEKQSPY
jgi:hypothetical protein